MGHQPSHLLAMDYYSLIIHHQVILLLKKLETPTKTNRNFNFFFNFIEIENFKIINQLIKQYGAFFRAWLGPELNVVLSDPNDIEV